MGRAGPSQWSCMPPKQREKSDGHVNQTKLVKFINDLEAIIYDPDEKKRAAAKTAARAVANHLRTDSIDMLLYDIETQYTAEYDNLGSQYIMAWDLVVSDRLDAIMLNYTGGTDKHKA